mmetsp:Transcript_8420/g.21561  ORF Transcript_8420/g.21561 Transcript_8420/m.21561 type:complete len:437 (+) Transcript_8420:57-1367(+)
MDAFSLPRGGSGDGIGAKEGLKHDGQNSELLRRISQLAVELDEEEKELWKHLRRKRSFQDRVAEKRAQLAELRDARRGVSAGHAEAAASVDRLTAEVAMMKRYEHELVHDVAVLRESNRILQGTFPPRPLPQVKAPTLEDAAARDSIKEESAQLQHEQIEHVRGHVSRLLAEKNELQQRQQTLLEKQHAAEQDRNRILSALQDDRKGINEIRAERIRLCEERCLMEREMSQIVQEAYFSPTDAAPANRSRWAPPPQRHVAASAPLAASSGLGALPPATSRGEGGAFLGFAVGEASSPMPAPVSGGVRVPVSLDTPAAFAQMPAPPGTDGAGGSCSRASSAGREAARGHWTRFDGESGAPRGPGVATGGGGTGASHWTRFDAGIEAQNGPSGGSLARTGSAAPTDGGFESDGGVAAAGAGITEWAGRLRDFRAARGG